MEYKYTADGRKVLVEGKLNSEQTIVREICVSGNDEFPHGEKFVVSKLFDKPAKTWKEARLEEIEKQYEQSMVNWQNKLIMNKKDIKTQFRK